MVVAFKTIASFLWLFGLAFSAPGPARTAPGRPFANSTPARTPFRVLVHPIRAASRQIATLAPAGTRGNVTTLSAALDVPIAAAYDIDDGNLYVLGVQTIEGVTDIRRVKPNGETLLFASLSVATANGIAYDRATRSFYVTSATSPTSSDPSLLAVSSKGVVSLLAGGFGTTSIDGKGTRASFNAPTAIVSDDSDGALYVTDYDRVRRVTPSGVVTTLTKAGALPVGPYPAGFGITYDPFDKNLYLANVAADFVERVSPTSGSVAFVAGNCYFQGEPSVAGFCDPVQRDGNGGKAFFGDPTGIAADPEDGSLYIADGANNTIRRVDLAGNVTTFAGSGIAANVDGTAPNAEFDTPLALTYDSRVHALDVLDVDPFSQPNPTVALRSVATAGVPPPPGASRIAVFNPVTPDVAPFAIDWRPTIPRSRTLLYSEGLGKFANMWPDGISHEQSDPNVESFPPNGLSSVIYGADGSSWIVDAGFQVQLDHRLPSGAFTAVPLTSDAALSPSIDDLTLDSGGRLWFVIPVFSGTLVGSVTPSGKVTEYTLASSGSGSDYVAFDGRGSLWISNGGLAKLDRSGHISVYDAFATGPITLGPDGNIWFTEPDAIGTVRQNNAIVLYPILAPIIGCMQTPCSRSIGAIAAGSDGALWFTERGAIGRLTPAEAFSEYAVPAARSMPLDISPGPDGNIWFTDAGAFKIGRLKIR